MTSRSRKMVAALAVLAMTAVGLVGQALAEKATVVRAGNLVLRLNGGVGPQKLPKNRLAPITLRASGSIGTVDGTHPPATKEVTIDFDKHGTINARGLPVCKSGKLQSRSTTAAKSACPKAIVGKGSTTVEVEFPEQKPFTASGPLVLFNGGVKGGVTTMFIHAYVNVPAPTAIVTRVKIKKIHKGPYGTRAIATIPRIAGGAGSLLRFNFSIHRTFKFRGQRQSYLLARCANGRFRAHAGIQMSDGTRISGSILRHCTPKG
jgi:hypothetical protein